MTANVVNIEDFGAEPNPDDPDATAAATNLTAFRDAAEAAGNGGTVYVPAGTYYVGHDGSGVINLTAFGPREPAGISIKGDGPEQSTLGVTEHLPDDHNHNLLIWRDGYDHGQVRVEEIKLQGNYENLGDLYGNNTGSRACAFDGTGTFDLAYAWIRGFYTNGVWYTGDVSGTIEYTTFEENGVGLENDSGGTRVSHNVSINPSADGNNIAVDHCEFKNGAGQAVNVRSTDVDVSVQSCYGEGLGVGVFKISAGGTIELRNSYMQPNNDWVEANLTDAGDFHGRFVVHRLDDRIASTPTVVLDHVKLSGCTRHTIETRDHELEVRGDMIAIEESALDSSRDCVIRDDAGGALKNVDIGRISVHNSDASVFSVPNADGSIDTLRRGGTDGIGDIGELTLASDDSGTAFEPDVVSQDEVGFDGSQDTSPDVSWVNPQEGQTLSGTTTLQIDASDAEDGDDTLSVDYSIDGGSWQTATYNADTGYYEDSWDTSAVTDGSHNLGARVTDSGGNTSSASVDVTVGKLFEAWTPRWNSDDDDWGVKTESSLQGDAALAFEPAGTDRTRYALSSDDLGEPSDVEVLDKFRVPAFTADENLGFHARVHLRSSIQNGNENGYWIEVEQPESSFRLAKYTGGDLTTLKRFGTPVEDTFFYRRFRVEGNQLKAKIWQATESEPSNWDVEITDDDHTSGWVGVGSYDIELVETDVFSAATGGEQAPFLDSDTAPSIAWASPTDGETVGGTVTVQIDASDTEDADDSLTVDYRVDGDSWQSASYNADSGYYEDSWDTTASADGSHTLEARVTDSAGNTAKGSISVTVDNTEDTTGSAPVVNRFSVSEAQRPDPHAEITAVWDVSDSDGDLDLVEIEVSDSSGTVQGVSWTVSGTTASDTDTFRVQDGDGATFDVSITVTDAAGQSTSVTKSVTA